VGRSGAQRAASWGQRDTAIGEFARIWLWTGADKPQRTYCDVKLGQSVAARIFAFVYLATLSTAQTNNKYLADSKELTGLCALRSGRGLIKRLSLHLSVGNEGIHAKFNCEWSGFGLRFELSTLQQNMLEQKVYSITLYSNTLYIYTQYSNTIYNNTMYSNTLYSNTLYTNIMYRTHFTATHWTPTNCTQTHSSPTHCKTTHRKPTNCKTTHCTTTHCKTTKCTATQFNTTQLTTAHCTTTHCYAT